jgi:hypothetical protein
MLEDAFKKGRADALARFKLANIMQGAAAFTPALNKAHTSSMGMPGAPIAKAPPPGAPLAAGSGKASVLG